MDIPLGPKDHNTQTRVEGEGSQATQQCTQGVVFDQEADHQADFETSLEDIWEPGGYYFHELSSSWGHRDDMPQLEEEEEDLQMLLQVPQGPHFEQKHDADNDLVEDQFIEFSDFVKDSTLDTHDTDADEEEEYQQGGEMEMEPAEEQQFPSKNTSRNVTVGAQFCSIVYDNLVSTNRISSEVLHTGTATTKGSAILSVDWACAVGGVSDDDTDGEQGNEEDEQGTFAIID